MTRLQSTWIFRAHQPVYVHLCVFTENRVFHSARQFVPLTKQKERKREKTTREKKERFSRNLSRNLLLFSTSAGTSKSYIKPEVPAYGTINTFRPLEIRLGLRLLDAMYLTEVFHHLCFFRPSTPLPLLLPPPLAPPRSVPLMFITRLVWNPPVLVLNALSTQLRPITTDEQPHQSIP